jgi:diaminohydroxyphosphoribosylaminopyrimidine deaminase/5-amino-6-(5-phosphoribosylamino)uracil reductase
VDLTDTDAQRRERMTLAIAEAERARGGTGDNPWVGCVIVDAHGTVVARGYTRGPGEDHAEIVAMHDARAAGIDLATATLYSTLEPCAFHGRTPACARAIVTAGVRRVVTGILDPNPRVDGAGLRILRDAGLEVIEDVCAEAITRQLAPWLLHHHPHEPRRRARALFDAHAGNARIVTARMAALYGLDEDAASALLEDARRNEGPR